MPHATASIDGTVVAETDTWENVEGNVYFPSESVKKEYFSDSSLQTRCPWKGMASYYNINVNGKDLKDSAWYYPTPGEKAQHIKDHVAFYKAKGVDVKTS